MEQIQDQHAYGDRCTMLISDLLLSFIDYCLFYCFPLLSVDS